jgi:hypothetical protein
LFALEREDELELDRTARKIPGEPVGDDSLVIRLSDRKRFDCVLIFLFRFRVPILDRGQTFDRLVFVRYL